MTILEDQLTEVARFHRDITHQPFPERPTLLAGERRSYRIGFLGEEMQEFMAAKNIADQADALVDLIYVCYGGLLEMGIYPKQAFRVVHAANMKKVHGANKRGGLYEAEKPAGWAPPDWDSILYDGAHSVELPAQLGGYIGLKGNSHDDLPLSLVKEPDPYAALANEIRGPSKLKILLLGHGRHGKDTVAELLRDRYGYTFTSSSMVCAEKVMMPYFKKRREEWFGVSPLESVKRGFSLPPLYKDVEECFADRHNHRGEWFKAIEAFNTPDKSMLAQAIFSSHDIYCGLRSAREFNAVRNNDLYDVCIWVDASQRHPPEGRDSCTVEPWMADFILDNNGTIEELGLNLDALMRTIGKATT